MGGFYANVDLIPSWFSWLQYLSPARYGLESLVQLQFEDFERNSPTIPNPIEYLGYNIGYGKCWAASIGIALGLRIICFYAFKRYAD